jgi:hypothetical protein
MPSEKDVLLRTCQMHFIIVSGSAVNRGAFAKTYTVRAVSQPSVSRSASGFVVLDIWCAMDA